MSDTLTDENTWANRQIYTALEREPCPSCGAQNVFLAYSVPTIRDARKHVECRICQMRGPIKAGEDKLAVDAWNALPRRVPEASRTVGAGRGGPAWDAREWGDGSQRGTGLTNIFCDEWETAIAVGIPHDTAHAIVGAHNAALSPEAGGETWREPDETAWLVELRGEKPLWWSVVAENDDGTEWTGDPAKALRFARKKDADDFIKDIGWTEAFASEHMWVAPRAVREG